MLAGAQKERKKRNKAEWWVIERERKNHGEYLLSRYQNLSTVGKCCWRCRKRMLQRKKSCTLKKLLFEILNFSCHCVVYEWNVFLSVWWHVAHSSYLIARFFHFIYLNQLHHFLLYRIFFSLFFGLTNFLSLESIGFFFTHWRSEFSLDAIFFKAIRFRTQVLFFYFHLHLVY